MVATALALLAAAAPGKPVRTVVVHGGAERTTLLGTDLLPWSRIDEFDWK